MSKLREAIAEARHTVNVCKIFWEKYWAFRATNPNPEVVFIYVGLPDMAATIDKQSPLWQRFAEFENERVARANLAELQAAPNLEAAERLRDRMKLRAGQGPAECDCAACTASKATRYFDA